MNYSDQQRAIERTRRMKVADQKCMSYLGPDTDNHGEWAEHDKTPRGGTRWNPNIIGILERTIIDAKYNDQAFGFDGLARIARTMGRSSDAVFQAMLKYDRSLLKHFCLEI